ncbi:MAG: leucine-rich repeat domain-containing protein, partial [Muribaculaceae bacterium]|nr:leucine-rich repeat domain-containing protein [Muribaculaceae bacterium]
MKSSTLKVEKIPSFVTYNNKKYYVTSIANFAFQECETEDYLTIPYGVQKIGSRAFYKCTGLKLVYIPSSVTEFYGEVFAETSLTRIFYSGYTPSWITKDWGEHTFVSNPSKVDLVLPPDADYNLFRDKKMWNTLKSVSYNSAACDLKQECYIDGNVSIIYYVCTTPFRIFNSTSYPIEAKITQFRGKTAAPKQKVFLNNSDYSLNLYVNDFAKKVCDNTVQTLDLTDLTDKLEVPSSLCEDAANLRTVKLGNISSIGMHAFRNCTSLTDLQIDESVT